jgi:plastocyanin
MSEDPIAILTASRSTDPNPAGRAHLWPLIIIMLVLLAVAVGFFDRGNQHVQADAGVIQTAERSPRVYNISYRYGVFSPTNLRIHTGDTVRFRNDGALPIRIIAELQSDQRTPEFDSVGDVQPGSYFSYTFATGGIFGYYNSSNGDESAVIIVR